MNTRANSPLTGVRWLHRGFLAGRSNPRAFLGGAALLMSAWLLPTLVQAVLHAAFRPGADAALVLSALMTLLSVALLAPLMGGYLRMMHMSAQGQPANAADIFVPFRTPQLAQRMISFAMLMLLVQVVLGAALTVAFGDFLDALNQWSQQVNSLLKQAEQARQTRIDPASVPPLPADTGRFLGLGSLIVLFCSAAFAIGLGQIALGGRDVKRSLADGLAGTLKNVVPLMVLAVSAFMVLMAVGLAGMFAAAIIAALVKMVGTAAVLVVLPLYLIFLAVCYLVMFSVGYQIWRDVSGHAVAEPAPPAAPGRLEA